MVKFIIGFWCGILFLCLMALGQYYLEGFYRGDVVKAQKICAEKGSDLWREKAGFYTCTNGYSFEVSEVSK